MSSAALKSVGAALVAGTGYMLFFRSTPQQNLVRADSNRKLVRRHSSGDHAFLPTKQDRKAIKEANKNVSLPVLSASIPRLDPRRLATPPRHRLALNLTRTDMMTDMRPRSPCRLHISSLICNSLVLMLGTCKMAKALASRRRAGTDRDEWSSSEVMTVDDP